MELNWVDETFVEFSAARHVDELTCFAQVKDGVLKLGFGDQEHEMTTMAFTRDQMAELLPVLKRFASGSRIDQ